MELTVCGGQVPPPAVFSPLTGHRRSPTRPIQSLDAVGLKSCLSAFPLRRSSPRAGSTAPKSASQHRTVSSGTPRIARTPSPGGAGRPRSPPRGRTVHRGLHRTPAPERPPGPDDRPLLPAHPVPACSPLGYDRLHSESAPVPEPPPAYLTEAAGAVETPIFENRRNQRWSQDMQAGSANCLERSKRGCARHLYRMPAVCSSSETRRRPGAQRVLLSSTTEVEVHCRKQRERQPRLKRCLGDTACEDLVARGRVLAPKSSFTDSIYFVIRRKKAHGRGLGIC